jgi:superfamily II DNA/RNA helicase
MLTTKRLATHAVKMFILDEADEMLMKGCKQEIQQIYRHLPPSLQVGFQ